MIDQILQLAWQDAWETIHGVLIVAMLVACGAAATIIFKEYL